MTMKKMSAIIFVLIGLLCASLANASVGIGISPSKIVIQVEEGQMQEIGLLVFNSGDKPMEINVASEGDIAAFTEIPQASKVIEPEPSPHSLPIKNGQSFSIKFSPPTTGEQKTYTGVVSASGSPTAGSQFGGSVGVAAEVVLIVKPAAQKPLFSSLMTPPVIVALLVAVLAVAVLLVRNRILSKKKQSV